MKWVATRTKEPVDGEVVITISLTYAEAFELNQKYGKNLDRYPAQTLGGQILDLVVRSVISAAL